MTALIVIIILLAVIILLLSSAILFFIKKFTYFSDKEKKFIIFVIDIFKEFGDDLGIQSKDEHQTLVNELERIKEKHLNIKSKKTNSEQTKT